MAISFDFSTRRLLIAEHSNGGPSTWYPKLLMTTTQSLIDA